MDIINPIRWTNGMLTSSSVSETDHPQWSSSSSYVEGALCILTSTHKIYECLLPHQASVAATSVVTISVASPCVVTWAAHGRLVNTPVVFSTTGVLPAGLVEGTRYYIIAPVAGSFNVATTPNGIPIITTVAGTGVHTATVVSTSPDVKTEDDALWLEIGSTNKYACVDDTWGSQTTATSSLTMTIAPGVPIDSIALLNLKGTTLNITCTRGATEIYNNTVVLQTDIGVTDWRSYFLAPIVAQDDAVFNNLLPYSDQLITITLTGIGLVGIGGITMGAVITIGSLQRSPRISIVDYSKKTTDEYGRIVVTPRAYSKRFSCSIAVPNSFVDQLASLLASIRTTPVIWVGSKNDYSSLIVWGFFKDFEIDIQNQILSYCSLTIEGLV